MAKFFGNLNLVFGVGVLLAIAVMLGLDQDGFTGTASCIKSTFVWLHVFFGILWIGLLYYLNFVQVPTMPKIPAEMKGAITGHIAPKVFFYFRYAALLTVITGLVVAKNGGFLEAALAFSGTAKVKLIGVGMWLGLIMAFNVWFVIWPNQKIALGIVEADADAKAKAGKTATLFSRVNTLLSLPMLVTMTMSQTIFG